MSFRSADGHTSGGPFPGGGFRRARGGKTGGRAQGGKREELMKTLAARDRTTLLLFGAALVAWAVTVERMRGMDAGPGTDLGRPAWFVVVWVTMTAAMMLPSTGPAARYVARLTRRVPTLLFMTGYLAVWTIYG